MTARSDRMCLTRVRRLSMLSMLGTTYYDSLAEADRAAGCAPAGAGQCKAADGRGSCCAHSRGKQLQ
jgi:hypothetical protein